MYYIHLQNWGMGSSQYPEENGDRDPTWIPWWNMVKPYVWWLMHVDFIVLDLFGVLRWEMLRTKTHNSIEKIQMAHWNWDKI